MTNNPPNYRDGSCCGCCRYGAYENPDDGSINYCNKYNTRIFESRTCDDIKMAEPDILPLSRQQELVLQALGFTLEEARSLLGDPQPIAKITLKDILLAVVNDSFVVSPLISDIPKDNKEQSTADKVRELIFHKYGNEGEINSC